jgi:septum formation protein
MTDTPLNQQPDEQRLARPCVILASGSPRRRRMLRLIGLEFEISVPDVDEQSLPGEDPIDYVARAAKAKALAVSAHRNDLPVLSADTIVTIDGQILGKPTSPLHAQEMLRCLAGNTHWVHTAMAMSVGDLVEVIIDSTQVHFRSMTDHEIAWYVASGEPMDKAGAYGVQGVGGLFVDSVEGSPHTVVGLPIHRLHELFEKLGLNLWDALAGRP